MRLIDADALSKELLERYLDREKQRPLPMSNGYDYFEGKQDECDFIEDYIVSEAPTIDAVPVVHGRWIYNKDTGEIRCNLCNALVGVTMYPDDVEPIAEVENFCFNCGAKMDEVSE